MRDGKNGGGENPPGRRRSGLEAGLRPTGAGDGHLAAQLQCRHLRRIRAHTWRMSAAAAITYI